MGCVCSSSYDEANSAEFGDAIRKAAGRGANEHIVLGDTPIMAKPFDHFRTEPATHRDELNLDFRVDLVEESEIMG
jgi:hypothetical protein